MVAMPGLVAGSVGSGAADSSLPKLPIDPVPSTSPPSCEGECAYWHAKASRRLKLAGHFERQRNRLRRAVRLRVELRGANGVLAGLLCIHGHEGSWSDPGAPYWGGLQMDRGFMTTYGGAFYRALGTADHWPASVQLAVGAEAYYSGRGFGPWPTSRRMCGI